MVRGRHARVLPFAPGAERGFPVSDEPFAPGAESRFPGSDEWPLSYAAAMEMLVAAVAVLLDDGPDSLPSDGDCGRLTGQSLLGGAR